MEEETRTCAHCGNDLMGRADKRFCSDQCRATATNRRKMANTGEQWIRRLNRILRQNRNVLHQVTPEGKTTVRRETLTARGFCFDFFTHLYQT